MNIFQNRSTIPLEIAGMKTKHVFLESFIILEMFGMIEFQRLKVQSTFCVEVFDIQYQTRSKCEMFL